MLNDVDDISVESEEGDDDDDLSEYFVWQSGWKVLAYGSGVAGPGSIWSKIALL